MTDWREIVRRYNQVVWKTAYRILGNYDDASDCLQDAFLSALTFSRKANIRNWNALLVRLVTARAIDRLRQRIRQRSLFSGQAELRDISAGNPSPSQEAQATKLFDRLRQALAELPTQQAQVFCLRCLDDLTYEEIATELALEPSHVGVLLHRARAQLRLLLSPAGDAGRDGVQP